MDSITHEGEVFMIDDAINDHMRVIECSPTQIIAVGNLAEVLNQMVKRLLDSPRGGPFVVFSGFGNRFVLELRSPNQIHDVFGPINQYLVDNDTSRKHFLPLRAFPRMRIPSITKIPPSSVKFVPPRNLHTSQRYC